MACWAGSLSKRMPIAPLSAGVVHSVTPGRRGAVMNFKELYDKGGELALQEISCKKPVLKNFVAQEIKDTVVVVVIEQPAVGQVRVANELRKCGLTVSRAGVHCVWQRHDLETMNKRVKALEARNGSFGSWNTGSAISASSAWSGNGSRRACWMMGS
jgi:hypothetical protein